MELQPLLHDLLCALVAPTQAWSSPDGQVRRRGVQGVWHGDVRVLSRAELTVDGHEPEPLTAGTVGADAVVAWSLVRHADGPGADPTLRLVRTRTVAPGTVGEELRLESATDRPVEVEVVVRLGCDLAGMDQVKQGRALPELAAQSREGAAGWHGASVSSLVGWDGSADVDLSDPLTPTLRWHAHVPAGGTWTGRWSLTASGGTGLGPAPAAATWSTPTVRAADRRVPVLLTQALADLTALRMRADFAPDDVFLAAGAPWFFTLFGRDSIWAARMLLPLGTELAGGTLRTLAARQGTGHDVATAEQPGKILHEVRAAPLDLGDGTVLPPVYYGTVDATPLFVCLLHDAWRWGMPRDEVAALLPAAERALAWMADHGDADGDGFLEYLDEAGTGLANQGWKDSGDSVQWRDGTLATGPIALCEVQGYAHEAALAGAALLEAFDRPGADRWRTWAADLATRFREAFWVSDDEGAYPAIALDADKRPVDSLTSNIGHLLGTGLLDEDEEAAVAARLGSPRLDSGFGLRTLATGSGGYWPLRYHGGTVWTHDTAIAIHGLARSGHRTQAAALAEGLLAAAATTAFRSPELHGGDPRGPGPGPVPYPAACRPQAWAAASAVVLLSAGLGLEPDVPAGRLRVNAGAGLLGALDVTGLRLAGQSLDVRVAADGTWSVRTDAAVTVQPA